MRPTTSSAIAMRFIEISSLNAPLLYVYLVLDFPLSGYIRFELGARFFLVGNQKIVSVDTGCGRRIFSIFSTL